MPASRRPPFIAPMAAALAAGLPPDDGAWAYEFKWDGVRAIVFVDGESVCVQGRRQNDVTDRYPDLAGLGGALEHDSAILDGEIVALNDQGRPSFQLLQRRMHVSSTIEARRRMAEVPAVYLAFDLLSLDGRDLMREPYAERRRLLDGLGLAGGRWQAPPAQPGGGAQVRDASRSMGLEGIVAKRLDSPYEPGRRSRCWLKIKNLWRQEFVVGGRLLGEGGRTRSFGSLLIGYYEGAGPERPPQSGDRSLYYAGNVGTGFTDRMLTELSARLAPLEQSMSPFVNLPAAKNVVWLRPELVIEVEFREWTGDGRLRAPSFKGIRDDKDPHQVVREVPEAL